MADFGSPASLVPKVGHLNRGRTAYLKHFRDNEQKHETLEKQKTYIKV